MPKTIRPPRSLLDNPKLAGLSGRPSPVDIATEICRAATLSAFNAHGKTYTRTVYTTALSQQDLARFDGRRRELAATLKDTLLWWVRSQGMTLPGDARVRLVADPDLQPGQLSVEAGLREDEAAKLGRRRR